MFSSFFSTLLKSNQGVFVLTWWLICFIATILTVFGKWYFTNTISRLRQTLSRQQRETLELKGLVQDARVTHQNIVKLVKNREMEVARMKKRIAELNVDLHHKQQANAPETKKNKKGPPI